MSNYYVADPTTECIHRGCQHANIEQLVLAKLIRERATHMPRFTQSLWCDFGDHAFSEKDKGKRVMTVMGTDPETDEDVEESWTGCSQHLPKGPAMSRITRGEIVP